MNGPNILFFFYKNLIKFYKIKFYYIPFRTELNSFNL